MAKKENGFEKDIKIEEIGYSFNQLLEKKISELPENFTALLLVNAEEYSDVVLGVIENFIVEKKLSGIYLTSNKQSSILLKMFQKKFKNFDDKKIFFLDCVTKELKKQGIERAVECTPQNLIDLNISINQALEVLETGSFFILDSISTLAIYNDERVLKKFVKTVVEKCYARKVNGIFLCNNTKNMKEVIEDTAPFLSTLGKFQGLQPRNECHCILCITRKFLPKPSLSKLRPKSQDCNHSVQYY
ncbi:hypothetical protein HZB88_00385 [archaeon]|nr:hypothetical protein [archaeon]